MKRMRIILLISFFLLIGIIYIKLNNNADAVMETSADDSVMQTTPDDGLRHIQILEDKIPVNNYYEVKENSTLIVQGKVTKKEESFYESYVDVDLEKEYESKGADKIDYCNIYTHYMIEVDKIFYGDCNDRISYRAVSGQIEDVVIDEIIPVEEGYSYVFVLKQSKREPGVYENALGYNSIARVEDDIIIENSIVGQCFSAGMTMKELEEAL